MGAFTLLVAVGEAMQRWNPGTDKDEVIRYLPGVHISYEMVVMSWSRLIIHGSGFS